LTAEGREKREIRRRNRGIRGKEGEAWNAEGSRGGGRFTMDVVLRGGGGPGAWVFPGVSPALPGPGDGWRDARAGLR